jgi:CheY-like chemotaxis protein
MSAEMNFGSGVPYSIPSTPLTGIPGASDLCPGTGSTSPPCVLLVDDEEAIREVMTDLLEDHNIRVLTAEDGVTGVEVYRANAADVNLVLLDLSLPGMSGEEVFRRFREIEPSVQVVLTSGYTKEEATSKFPASSLVGFVQKPFQWTQLATTILNYVDSAHRAA